MEKLSLAAKNYSEENKKGDGEDPKTPEAKKVGKTSTFYDEQF